jgi:c-di-GMP-binding flagellar brake protein YcgR
MNPEPHHLKLQLHGGEHRFPTGSSVEIYYRNDRGVFRVATDVLGQEGKVLSVRHSERVSHEQRRKFFRKRVSEPAHVRYDSEEAESVHTRLLDLGGGGASFSNPDGMFKLGDLVRIDLTARDGTRLSLHAKVLRLSERGNVCHVEFYSVRESLRDKIYNMIFAPPPRRKNEES